MRQDVRAAAEALAKKLGKNVEDLTEQDIARATLEARGNDIQEARVWLGAEAGPLVLQAVLDRIRQGQATMEDIHRATQTLALLDGMLSCFHDLLKTVAKQ